MTGCVIAASLNSVSTSSASNQSFNSGPVEDDSEELPLLLEFDADAEELFDSLDDEPLLEWLSDEWLSETLLAEERLSEELLPEDELLDPDELDEDTLAEEELLDSDELDRDSLLEALLADDELLVSGPAMVSVAGVSDSPPVRVYSPHRPSEYSRVPSHMSVSTPFTSIQSRRVKSDPTRQSWLAPIAWPLIELLLRSSSP